jgi:hypothetical protein
MKTIIPLKDKRQTGDAMYDICFTYNKDLETIYVKRPGITMIPLSKFTLGNYYDFVKMIPYKIDTRPTEVVGRPLRLVQLKELDCKKKAIMIGSYAALKKIPFRFIASSSRPSREIHHVYPELKIENQWVAYDATYSHYYVGMPKRTTAKEVL